MTLPLPDPRGTTRIPTRKLVTLLRAAVVLLSLQFVLGIWANLFGSFPSTQRLGTAVSYAGDPVLTGHYVLAVVLVLLGIVLVVVAFRGPTRASLRAMVVLGLLAIVWASAAGVAFVASGFSSPSDSFSMALAFIFATSFYGVAQALALPRPPGTDAVPEGSGTPPSPR